MKLIASFFRILLVTGVVLVWLGMFLLPLAARATGGSTPPPPTPGATASASSAATASGGSGERAIGLGSTGLTSTAPCLGSRQALFNLFATTYVEQGCVIRLYSNACTNAVCRQAMACLDPDLIPEAKTVLGCK